MLCLDAMSSRDGFSQSSPTSRRESHDSDATKAFTITSEMKRAGAASPDSYESIVLAFEDRCSRVIKLEREVERL